MNRVEVSGGLTRDPEYRMVGSYGTHLLEMTVAVNGTRYDSEQRQQVVKTTFVQVQAWGYVAEFLTQQHGPLSKGDEVHVVGELDQRTVEKSDGSKESKTRVTAVHIDVLRRRHTPDTTDRGSEAPTGSPTSEPPF